MTTDSYELPQMPEPAGWIEADDLGATEGADGFTADQVREYALLAVKEERERAAKICEKRMAYWQIDDIRRYEDEQCADAIRRG